MTLLIVSFLSGVLTILAPCILPLLPVILGASSKDSSDKYRPYIIIASLIFSIVIFSLLLKASTIFIGVDPIVWKLFSGLILILFGIITIFPNLWKSISVKFGLSNKSNQNLSNQASKKGVFGSIMIGFSLGPVFSSCSPTYAIILAVILPVSFITGLLNLFAYALGLGFMLLLIALLGQKIVQKTKWAASPNSLFKKLLGILFLLVGVAIITGYDKKIEAQILDSGYFDVTRIEQHILDKVEIDESNGKNNLNLNLNNMDKINNNDYKEAYFAGGCFWCMEGIFEAQAGVKEAIAGYIGGTKESANYTDVSSGNTKHREGVKVVYNPNVISYDKLVELYWTQIDPTDEGGQFADRGFHYTTAMYYKNEKEKEILENSKNTLSSSSKFDKEIVTKILPLETFFEAEDYHQDYYKKSSFRYNMYKKGSGRDSFIEENWEDRIDELQKSSSKNIIKKGSGYKDYSQENLSSAVEENIVLFFHAEWCPTCKEFEKNVLSGSIPDDILILKVDYDLETDLKRKYNIVSQTSFVLVDKNGDLKLRWIGARDIDNIIEKINQYKLGLDKSKIYTKEELKAMLTPLQYKVAVEGGTEPPFDNAYWDNHEDGIYVDIIDKTPLFSSTDKFDSGTGWPSFTKPIDENFLEKKDDYKLAVKRTEVKSGSSHLGHVFEDGPSDKGGLRYCINSAALEFIPKDQLEKKGYGKYLQLFD